jgi:hypothetical protein
MIYGRTTNYAQLESFEKEQRHERRNLLNEPVKPQLDEFSQYTRAPECNKFDYTYRPIARTNQDIRTNEEATVGKLKRRLLLL